MSKLFFDSTISAHSRDVVKGFPWILICEHTFVYIPVRSLSCHSVFIHFTVIWVLQAIGPMSVLSMDAKRDSSDSIPSKLIAAFILVRNLLSAVLISAA